MTIKIKFSFILIFLSCIAFAQKLSLQEMINLNYKDADEFDTFVVSKGYDFSKFVEESNYDTKSYSFKENNQKGADYWISKHNYYLQGFYAKNMVSWQTSNKNYYLSIKEQIKKLGFTFSKTENEDGNLKYEYHKGKILVSLYSLKRVNTFGVNGVVYEINVTELN